MAHEEQPAGRTSGWAIASLLCSLGVCPVLTLAAPLAGLRALVAIRTTPGLRGTRRAIAGILLGTLMTALWAGVGWWWHGAVRVPLREGPPLAALLAGNTSAFEAAFTTPGVAGEATALATEITARFGVLHEVRVDATSDAPPVERWQRFVVPYALVFDRGWIAGRAEFVLTDEQGRMRRRFGWLHLRDAVGGDLVYPASAADRIHAALAREKADERPE